MKIEEDVDLEDIVDGKRDSPAGGGLADRKRRLEGLS